jgi:hypothetical protein
MEVSSFIRTRIALGDLVLSDAAPTVGRSADPADRVEADAVGR